MDCPPRELVVAFVSGTLTVEDSAPIAAHLETCETCATFCSAAAASQVPTHSVGPPSQIALRDEPVPAQIGRYRVLELLGEGGMGAVYAAYHPDLDRRVALKFLKVGIGTDGAAAQEHLVREAQTMAKLGHPNVVAVYDVASDQGRGYIVMELVRGQTLAQRLLQGLPPVAEAMSIIVQAGRGLKAAHQAGIIHRDFKPANVLLSEDGRVRVADFGVARLPRGFESDPPLISSGSSSPHSATTQAGRVVGTLPYMAPERAAGAPADERTDQFSFCAAAFETLYGRRPFDLSRPAIDRYERPVEVPSRGEPRFVRAAILRGLSREPNDRFPSMDALLTELEREPLRLGRLLPWAALIVVMLGSSIALYRLTRPLPVPGCSPEAIDLSSTWGPEPRAALNAGFAALGTPAATDAAAQVGVRLDAFVQEWTREATAACLADSTHTLGQRHPQLECLAQQRMRLRALVEVLTRPTAAMVDRASFAAWAMTPPHQCAAPNTIASLPRIPEEPHVREEVERARFEIATAQALILAGQQDEATTRLPKLHQRAQELGFRPLEAEVAHALAETYSMTGDGPPGLEWARKARDAALASGLELLAADSLAMSGFFGSYSGKLDQAEDWLRLSRALLERAGGSAMVEARIENALSVLTKERGDEEASARHQQRAFELRRDAFGPRHPRTLNFLNNLAASYEGRCEREKAIELLKVFADPEAIPQAVTVYSAGLGRLAGLLIASHRLDEAERVLDMNFALVRQGGISANAERLAAKSSLLTARGDFDGGIATARQALALQRTAGDESWVTYRFCLSVLIEALLQAGHFAEALPLTVEAYDKAREAGGSTLGGTLLQQAEAQMGLGHAAEALAAGQQARQLLNQRCRSPKVQAALDLLEAKALAALRRDPQRVAELKQNVARLIENQGWAERFRQGLRALDAAAVPEGRPGSGK